MTQIRPDGALSPRRRLDRRASAEKGKDNRAVVRGDVNLEAQMLNAFNKTNLSGLESRLNQGNFGQFNSTRGARVVQFNVRLEF